MPLSVISTSGPKGLRDGVVEKMLDYFVSSKSNRTNVGRVQMLEDWDSKLHKPVKCEAWMEKNRKAFGFSRSHNICSGSAVHTFQGQKVSSEQDSNSTNKEEGQASSRRRNWKTTPIAAYKKIKSKPTAANTRG